MGQELLPRGMYESVVVGWDVTNTMNGLHDTSSCAYAHCMSVRSYLATVHLQLADEWGTLIHESPVIPPIMGARR